MSLIISIFAGWYIFDQVGNNMMHIAREKKVNTFKH